jgi:hypothetical protein
MILALCPQFRDQGVGGSNPLSPTISFYCRYNCYRNERFFGQARLAAVGDAGLCRLKEGRWAGGPLITIRLR